MPLSQVDVSGVQHLRLRPRRDVRRVVRGHEHSMTGSIVLVSALSPSNADTISGNPRHQ